jgi:DNA-binding IclR family transcriptional regulator
VDFVDESGERDQELRGASSVRAVDRAVAILTALADQPRPLGVGELAAAVNLHPATVHRLLASLARLNWVERLDPGKYGLGLRMLGVAALGVAQSPLLSNSTPILQRLAEVSGWSAYLSVIVGNRVVDLARYPGQLSQAAPTFAFGPGRSYPAHASADGKLLMAYLPKQELDDILDSEPLKAFTERTITKKGELVQELETIRARGFATDRGERSEFVKGVAVPVFAEGTVVAALLCFGRFDLTDEWELWLKQEMSFLAEELSHRLGVLE